MTCTSISAPAAHAFNASQWLENFEKVGGGYALTDSGLSLLIEREGGDGADFDTASDMAQNLSPQDREELIAYIAHGRLPYDPARWLASFQANGGSVTVIEGGPALGYPEEHNEKLSAMRASLSPSEVTALREYLRGYIAQHPVLSQLIEEHSS